MHLRKVSCAIHFYLEHQRKPLSSQNECKIVKVEIKSFILLEVKDHRTKGMSDDPSETNNMRSGRACSPPVPGPPTANNIQVTREGAGSNLG